MTGEKKGVEAKDGNKNINKNAKELLIFKYFRREKYKINPEKSHIEMLINIYAKSFFSNSVKNATYNPPIGRVLKKANS